MIWHLCFLIKIKIWMNIPKMSINSYEIARGRFTLSILLPLPKGSESFSMVLSRNFLLSI